MFVIGSSVFLLFDFWFFFLRVTLGCHPGCVAVWARECSKEKRFEVYLSSTPQTRSVRGCCRVRLAEEHTVLPAEDLLSRNPSYWHLSCHPWGGWGAGHIPAPPASPPELGDGPCQSPLPAQGCSGLQEAGMAGKWGWWFTHRAHLSGDAPGSLGKVPWVGWLPLSSCLSAPKGRKTALEQSVTFLSTKAMGPW